MRPDVEDGNDDEDEEEDDDQEDEEDEQPVLNLKGMKKTKLKVCSAPKKKARR